MKPEQFLTEEQFKDELKTHIFNTFESLELTYAALSISIQKKMSKMSNPDLRRILARLQTLQRQINQEVVKC